MKIQLQLTITEKSWMVILLKFQLIIYKHGKQHDFKNIQQKILKIWHYISSIQVHRYLVKTSFF
jgi:hypothetical protein